MMTQSLVLPFPIRGRYMAQIVVPVDMTKAEAERLCAFISIAGNFPRTLGGESGIRTHVTGEPVNRISSQVAHHAYIGA